MKESKAIRTQSGGGMKVCKRAKEGDREAVYAESLEAKEVQS